MKLTDNSNNKLRTIEHAWISLSTSTRFLTLGVKFSSTSECLPARFWSLFCTPNHNVNKRKHQGIIPNETLLNLTKTDIIINHFKRKKWIQKHQRQRTNLEGINKVSSILRIQRYTQTIKQSEPKSIPS